MIIVLNGYPGVGKLTIATELASQLGARLLDIHTMYNVAFALTEPKSSEFYETIEEVEAIAHNLVLRRPEGEPTVLTTMLAGDSEWGDAEWGRIVRLGEARPPLCVIHVWCDIDENVRRIESVGRSSVRKLRDPDMARRNHDEAKPLYGLVARHLLKLDATSLEPAEAATRIAEWLDSI